MMLDTVRLTQRELEERLKGMIDGRNYGFFGTMDIAVKLYSIVQLASKYPVIMRDRKGVYWFTDGICETVTGDYNNDGYDTTERGLIAVSDDYGRVWWNVYELENDFEVVRGRIRK